MKEYKSICDFLQKESFFTEVDISWFVFEELVLSSKECQDYFVVRTKIGSGFDRSWFNTRIFSQVIKLDGLYYLVDSKKLRDSNSIVFRPI